MMTRTRIRRWILGAAILLLVVAGALIARPAYLWIRAGLRDRPVAHDLPSGYVDDASRLNSTHVAEIWSIPAKPAAAEAQLRSLLLRAQAEHLSVAIAGARHSMGGHTIAPDGIVLDMLPFSHMELDAENRILSVGAGARWWEVIPYLNARGFSVAVMQSNNNFSVGGSISVNCHGWQHNHAPIASTVDSLRLMKADGTIVRCSRDENAELFRLVLGGYGLFGVILDVGLRVVPNERYRPEVEVLAAEDYARRFAEKVNGAADIGMVYGRLCIVPGEDAFLREAILTVFRQAPCRPEEIPPMHAAGHASLRRKVYRAQIGSDAGKEVRWKAERQLGERFSNAYVSRNQLLNEEAEIYQDRNEDRADILHEYFIPPHRVEGFLAKARKIIPQHEGDLLNVTVRNVHEDTDTFLRYADRDLFAFVMLFNQARTPNADSRMEAMTRELIDAALEADGRYYLPYRLHATNEQFAKAYPQAAEFFRLKRQYDPEEIFQNQFYLKYGSP
ncbi:MAG TPA: FAD-binding oxidoreductase [Lacipirellulaceae bacterium]|nr:FAD-binding oxidoreductase [Lacipirellulaceae bacterium]